MSGGMQQPLRPWARMKRKAVAAGAGDEAAGGWVYFTSSGAGREHATAAVERMTVPQGCDQCGHVISDGSHVGARSFRVSRGLKPTTLYLCGRCVAELCAAGGIPEPGAGA